MDVTAMEEEVLYSLVPRNRRNKTSHKVLKEASGSVRRERKQEEVWARDLTVSSRKESRGKVGRLEIG